MKTLTAQEFLKITRANPQWAKTLTEDVIITGNVILPKNHPLKALSPNLIFKDHARFHYGSISIAEGIFHQGVDFSGSQIQEIGQLDVLGTDEHRNAAIFWGCKNLTVARGTFPGWVSFAFSGIREIADDLHITDTDKNKFAASFRECRSLTVAKGTFSGCIDFNYSAIQKIADTLHVTTPNVNGDAAYFKYCPHLRIASGTFCGTVDFSETPITCTRNLKITVPEGKPKAIFTEHCLEEVHFPLEEIDIPEKLKEKLRRKIIQNLHKNLKSAIPALPLEL